VASFHGWNKGLLVILMVCGITSITAAISNFADRNAERLLNAETVNDQQGRLQADYNRIRAELATISATGTPKDLKDLADAYKKKAADEAARGFCGPKCQAAEGKETETLATLAQVTRKAELEAKLVTIETKLADTKRISISGRAKMAVAWVGLSNDKAMMLDGMLDSFLTIAVIESLVYLGIFGVPMLIAGIGGHQEIPEAPTAKIIQLAERREDEILQRLISMILRSEDGSICCSGRELASRLKVPHSTFSIWLARWIKDGKIIAEPVTAHKRRYRAAA
jgi:hypothetical protein